MLLKSDLPGMYLYRTVYCTASVCQQDGKPHLTPKLTQLHPSNITHMGFIEKDSHEFDPVLVSFLGISSKFWVGHCTDCTRYAVNQKVRVRHMVEIINLVLLTDSPAWQNPRCLFQRTKSSKHVSLYLSFNYNHGDWVLVLRNFQQRKPLYWLPQLYGL